MPATENPCELSKIIHIETWVKSFYTPTLFENTFQATSTAFRENSICLSVWQSTGKPPNYSKIWAGKELRVNNHLIDRVRVLEAASKGQNHWAQCAIKRLMEIKTGRIGKDNVFARPGVETKPGTDIFYLALSGVTATMQRLDNDVYLINDLVLDPRFLNQGGQKTATGLYQVGKDRRGQWKADFVKDGHLKPDGQKQRLVGISNGGYKNADIAANHIAGSVTKSPAGGGGQFFESFDMHYTHNPGRLGGLVHYRQARKPLGINSANGSALMLADTMAQARDIKGITWVASYGGSAVLTQAMKILADRNIKLDKHSVYLDRAGSDPEEAVRQAHRLELKLDRNFIGTNPLDAGNGGQFGMIKARLMNPGDKEYKWSHALIDSSSQVANIAGGSALAVSALAAANVTMSLPVSAPTMAALLGIGAALGKGIGLIKVGDSFLEGVAPRFYQKRIGKYK